jgi:iron(III) transport system permease protein
VTAKPWQAILRILLPAAFPALVFAALIVFTLSFSELGVPLFLGIRVYPAMVFSRRAGLDPAAPEAVCLLLPLVPVGLFLLLVQRRLLGGRAVDVFGLRGMSAPPIVSGKRRAGWTLYCGVMTVLAIAPIAALAWRAFRGGGFSEIHRWLGSSLKNSLILGMSGATLLTFAGIVLGHAAARRRLAGRLVHGLAMLAFLTPAAALGIGLFSVWNRPAAQWLYAGPGILVAGYLARYFIVPVQVFASVLAQSPRHLEDAAAVFSAGYARRFCRIVIPAHVRGVAGAWVLALVFCLRDLEMAILFYPPGWEPLTVKIFTLEANGPEEVIAALSIVQVGLTAACLGLGSLVLSWRSRGWQ